MQNHKKYMKKCIALAKKAEGKTSPNPMVGAILVNSKGEILSQGYHKAYGKPHAEVECINNYEKKYANNIDYNDLTLYVNLEPCNHYGKTPPCTDLILKKGIKKVIIAVADPNPEHTGGAIRLKKAKVEVIENILSQESIKLNEIFFKNTKENKPFIAIKTATTLDGKIATKTGSSKWITSEKSRKHVQKIRKKYDAILTSSNTIEKDNPSLTIRNSQKKLARVVVDTNLKTDPESKVYSKDGAKIYVAYCNSKKLIHNPKEYPSHISFLQIGQNEKKKVDLTKLTEILYKKGIRSILVEAGGILCAEIIKQNLADKIYQFIAPKILADITAKSFVEGFNILNINECRNFKITALKNLNPDILIELEPVI